jgi:hypothetical protein
VLRNKELKRVFGTEREINGGKQNVTYEEYYNLYSLRYLFAGE